MAEDGESGKQTRPAEGGQQSFELTGAGDALVRPPPSAPLCTTLRHGARVAWTCRAIRMCCEGTHRRKGRALRTYSNGKACTAVSFCCCLTGFTASLAIHWCTMLAISCVYICVAVRSFELQVACSCEWSHNAVKPMCRREFLHTTRHGLRIGMVPSKVASPY